MTEEYKMKALILFFVVGVTFALAQRYESQERQPQRIESGQGSRSQAGLGTKTDSYGSWPYGCPGCPWGGPYGGRGPGYGRGWRGYGGPMGGYGPGPRWGSWRHGHHGPWHHGHHRGYFHGRGYRYYDEEFCPTYCPSVEHPVCGSDGQTYGNMCKMRMEACRTGENLYATRRGPC